MLDYKSIDFVSIQNLKENIARLMYKMDEQRCQKVLQDLEYFCKAGKEYTLPFHKDFVTMYNMWLFLSIYYKFIPNYSKISKCLNDILSYDDAPDSYSFAPIVAGLVYDYFLDHRSKEDRGKFIQFIESLLSSKKYEELSISDIEICSKLFRYAIENIQFFKKHPVDSQKFFSILSIGLKMWAIKTSEWFKHQNDSNNQNITVYIPVNSETISLLQSQFDKIGQEEEFILLPLGSNVSYAYHNPIAINQGYIRLSVPVDNVVVSFGHVIPILGLNNINSDSNLLSLCIIKLPNQGYVKLYRSDILTQSSNVYVGGERLCKSSHKWPYIAIATAMLGSPSLTSVKLPFQELSQRREQKNIDMSKHLFYLNNAPLFLQAIAHVESSGGKNIDHPTVTYGINKGTKAIGLYGIMPITIKETIHRTPHLKNKYGHLMHLDPVKDHDYLHGVILSNPELYYDIAKSHYNYLKRVFNGDEKKMAYAWHHGVTGTMKATISQIDSHPYVQKVMQGKFLLQAKSKKRSFKKSNGINDNLKINKNFSYFDVDGVDLIGEKIFTDNLSQSFIIDGNTLSYHTNAEKDMQIINDLMSSGDMYKLNQKGKYSDSSFIVYSPVDNKNKWLIKPESNIGHFNVLGESYTLNEYLFYLCVKMFGMEKHAPLTYLGKFLSTTKDGKSISVPAVAVKILPDDAVPLSSVIDNGIEHLMSSLNYFLENGILHKLSALLYILGDVDAHRDNIFVSRDNIWIIDHGMSFIQSTMGKDLHVYVPAFLWVYKNYKNQNIEVDKYGLPLISQENSLKDLVNWLSQLDIMSVRRILSEFGLQQAGNYVYERWLKLVSCLPLEDYRADKVINNEWYKAAILTHLEGEGDYATG